MTDRKILTEIRRDDFSFARLTECCPELLRLKGVPQNPEYHAEGDVYRHTELVCERLTELPGWERLADEEQELLFLAAAFHDIGKVFCTKQENGKWVSPKHTAAGEKEFRQLVYREAERFGLTFAQRELVAQLIRHHGLPVWSWAKKRPEYGLLKAAESIPLRFLYLLSMADVTGRENRAGEELTGHVELFGDYAKELGIWDGAYAFANSYTRFQYFHRDDLPQEAQLYDDTSF
ncbi:MAG: HD domain-containing protein, partial [Lachnospiraceae bacterium]|nr:HD domain-containing protein [Lachnospiraceae bacterium]